MRSKDSSFALLHLQSLLSESEPANAARFRGWHSELRLSRARSLGRRLLRLSLRHVCLLLAPGRDVCRLLRIGRAGAGPEQRRGRGLRLRMGAPEMLAQRGYRDFP